ncbi:MAG: YihA family ribosome biogenesis GTP-binding protein [Oscillospiraceae bacterium]|nr:YihA family ribosome biogenesis GTP-binding protein [Oscillospiraceae bacterium]
MNFNNVEFMISAANPKDFPEKKFPEIAFAGKSNVGKSSVINRLLQRKNFARVGDKPGKTIHINYFVIDKQCYFVDLPGYGYAKVSQKEKDRWAKLMDNYFSADRIDLGIMIVDARHAPTQNDITMANWFIETGCPFVVVANKLDKLKKSEILPNMQAIRENLSLPEHCEIIPFSAEKGTGRDELVKKVLNTVMP